MVTNAQDRGFFFHLVFFYFFSSLAGRKEWVGRGVNTAEYEYSALSVGKATCLGGGEVVDTNFSS